MKLEDPGLENELVSLKMLTEADRDVLAETSAVEAMWQSGLEKHVQFAMEFESV